MNWAFIAASAGVLYLVTRVNKLNQKQDENDEQSVRQPQYYSTGDNNGEFIPIVKVYKDGPISWVAEASDGSKWVQYSNSTTRPPQLMRKNAIKI
jgi:hypothetical protein